MLFRTDAEFNSKPINQYILAGDVQKNNNKNAATKNITLKIRSLLSEFSKLTQSISSGIAAYFTSTVNTVFGSCLINEEIIECSDYTIGL